jgi:hypothetical protein
VDWFETKPSCPICRLLFDVEIGTGPRTGTMSWIRLPVTVPGETCPSCIEITIDFPAGQDNRGKDYQARIEKAYLPDNNLGNLVLELFKTAFRRRILFDIGYSMSYEGRYWPVISNISLKTSIEEFDPPDPHGYPDKRYLTRVIEQLRSRGVSIRAFEPTTR